MFESMRHNSDHSITGLLLYDQGSFCQVLEGEKKDLKNLYKKIEKDPRHFNVNLISEKDIDIREFSAWSMRFINLDFYDRDKIKGYQKDNGNLMDWNAINASLAKNILMQFKSI
ncbi:MAG: BLUF domain-containing protein [Betaproteobacteria bacterium]|nr:BLUF domain-containing protein [Betaproteobacteria bacterium]